MNEPGTVQATAGAIAGDEVATDALGEAAATREDGPGESLPPPSAPLAHREAAPASSLERLIAEPSRFAFDAAIALLMRASGHGDPGDAVRFQAALGLAFVPSDIDSVKRSPAGFIVETGVLGLTGPAGVLPRPYTEMTNDEHRRRSSALAAFLDLLAQRPIAQFALAGLKYRPHRAADAAAIAGPDDPRAPQDGLREILLALIGHADRGLVRRLQTGVDPLLYYAGAFAARPRSATRLAAMLSEWLGQTVDVEQFSGAWLELDPDQRTALPRGGTSKFNQLGVDAAAGARAWDIQSRITLRIGPLELDAFKALLPGGVLLKRIAAFTRAYLGLEVGFAVNPILAAHAVPAPALGPASPFLLGWTGWLPVGKGRTEDATEAKFSDSHLGA